MMGDESKSFASEMARKHRCQLSILKAEQTSLERGAVEYQNALAQNARDQKREVRMIAEWEAKAG